MFPPFNSLSHPSKHIRTDGTASQQPVVSMNPFAGNSSNMLQNNIQIRSPMGMFPQSSFPPNGSVNYVNSVPALMNPSNQLQALQNNQIPAQQVGQFGNMVPNTGQMTPSQLAGMILAQPFSQNISLQNLQLFLANAVPNVNQLPLVQQPNPSQVPHLNGFPGVGNPTACQNQGAQTICSQNPLFFGNTQYIHVQQLNQNQQNLTSPVMGLTGLRPLAAANRQKPRNYLAPVNANSSQPERSQNMPSSACNRQQEKHNYKGGINTSNPSFRNSPRKDFGQRRVQGPFQRRVHRSHFHDMRNGKRKFEFAGGHKDKGTGDQIMGKFGPLNSMKYPEERKRDLLVTYSEQEIQQWRDERRKNYPSKANMEKKMTDSQTNEMAVKMRRKQLKEILAKQAELGFEMAEIPLHYLSDVEKKDQLPEESSKPSTKKQSFRNKHDKRGRPNRNDRFNKKQRLASRNSTDSPSLSKSRTTLLQKLLSKDIKKDRSRLLQVFRFMVANSFFKDWPEQSLKFPRVLVTQNGCVEEKCQILSNDNYGGCHAMLSGNSDNGDDESSDDKDDSCVEEDSGGKKDGLPDEEEGEIID